MLQLFLFTYSWSQLPTKTPDEPLKTMEILCTGLKCRLSDFCEVTLSSTIAKKKSKVRKLSFQTTPHHKKNTNSFPNPDDYE